MKLTEKQLQVINRAKQLETEHGQGNIFIRWINDYWKACFIIHKAGNDNYDIKLSGENKINGRILNALQEKGLIQTMDTNHIEREDFNTFRSDKFIPLGGRVRTELI